MQNPVLQARLACNSPHNFYWPWMDESSTVDDTLVSASGKMLLLDRLIPCLLAKGHKILIFSQFKTQLDIIEEWATELRSWKCCRIDGAIAQADRRAQIQDFNTKNSHKIFLLSTRAGGQGINLTAADTVILFDSDWNPQQDLQAQDRAHRIGQNKPAIIYRLATKGTVEQTLLEKADAKRRLERLVIQKGKFRSLLDPTATSQDVDELRRVLGENEFDVSKSATIPSRFSPMRTWRFSSTDLRRLMPVLNRVLTVTELRSLRLRPSGRWGERPPRRLWLRMASYCGNVQHRGVAGFLFVME